MGHDRLNRRPRRRRIAVVTGTRAEYGLLRSPLKAIQGRPGLDLRLIVTGMHLVRKFGWTLRDIEADGWRVDARVTMQRGRDDALDGPEGLARGVRGIARFLVAARCDVVVVLGDRIEAMAGALAGMTTGRCVAHIHGGDRAPGDIDDALRHAITKLAHVHFPATRESARRIIRLGEDRRRVIPVGAPGLDELAEAVMLRRRRKAPSGEALVIHHASGRTAAEEFRATTSVLEAVQACGLRRRIIYPNSDRGHDGVLAAIREHVRNSASGEVRVHRSLPRERYVAALAQADVLVGNSSSGIIEAPFVGTPSVNIGDRQRGREAGGPSVFHCREHRAVIIRTIRKALQCRTRPGSRTVYGDGRAGPRIAEALARLSLDHADFPRKLNSY